MDRYLTGATIKGLREKRGMTQAQLAERLSVSELYLYCNRDGLMRKALR